MALAGAVRNGNGTITIPGIAADANGVITVPALLLERLGNQDATISMQVTGLAANSTFTSTAYVRPYAPAPEGVYVQVFDANGVALNQPTTRIDGPGMRATIDDGTVGASPSADGGFAARWVRDADGDGEGDGIVVQRFGADGALIGTATTIDGLPQQLFDSDDAGFDIAALDNGGYAVS